MIRGPSPKEFLIGALLGVLIALLFSCDTRAHDWYHQECCSDKDCKRVDDPREISEDGDFYIYNSMRFKKRDSRVSQDEFYHVCIPTTYFGGMRYIRCLYRPVTGA